MVFNDEEAGNYINKNFISLRFVSGDTNTRKYREKFKVPGYPTVILFDNSGREIERLIGFNNDKEQYLHKLTNYAQGINTLQALRDSFQQDSNNVDLNYKLGMRHIARYEYQKAMPYLENVLNLDPNNQSGYHDDCLFYKALYQTRYANNIKPLRKYLTGDPQKKYLLNGYFTMIGYYQQREDTAKILAAFKEAIDRIPQNTTLLNSCAWYIYTNKIERKYDWAISLAKKAVQIDPEADHIWDTLAWLYYEKGELGKAIAAMTKAVELAPDQTSYKENLAKIQQERSL